MADSSQVIGREDLTDEYQRRTRRTVFAAGELPDDMIDAIRNADMDECHQHLDGLIPDWTA